MFSDKELHRIVEQINDNYKNEELFYIPEGHTMPNRNTTYILHLDSVRSCFRDILMKSICAVPFLLILLGIRSVSYITVYPVRFRLL